MSLIMFMSFFLLQLEFLIGNGTLREIIQRKCLSPLSETYKFRTLKGLMENTYKQVRSFRKWFKTFFSIHYETLKLLCKAFLAYNKLLLSF